MFAYCGNNPVNCSDPTGEETCDLLKVQTRIVPAGIGEISIGLFLWATIGWLFCDRPSFYSNRTTSSSGISEPSSNTNQQAAEKSSSHKVTESANAMAGSTPATPPDSSGNNGRKFNVHKSESTQWNSLARVKHSNLRTSGHGSNQRFYDWDYTHNDIEVYNCRGEHLGSMDPITGEMYKPPVPGRIIIVP